jgi:hypothetical protein
MSSPQPTKQHDRLLQMVVEYFRPPQDFFWQWADDGKVIEWREGGTICFREELIEILKDIAHDGLPSLHKTLLTIAACKKDWGEVRKMRSQIADMSHQVAITEGDRLNRELFEKYAADTLVFFDRLTSLPENYRTGDARGHLIRTIFEKDPHKLSFAHAQEILFEFNSGRLDKYIFRAGLGEREHIFQSMVADLAEVGKIFPTTASLEIKLRTGIDVTPDALPEIELPEERPSDLLQQLSADPKTVGLANLTQHLIAALNIPMHAQGQSDQSFGGVSDISNRGNFDRLLLSELAHDDLSLMARLANNEALYLRREELPDDVNRQRIIMVDTTLKMWGLPRVFAISAALACARNNKLNAAIDAYVLGGKHCKPVRLDTKDGVVQTLSQLDAALHCGDALNMVMNEAPGSDRDEYFLITEIESIQTPAFQLALSKLKRPLSFLIAVGRDGQLQFFEFINGRRKLVSEARFNLDELLFPKMSANKEKKAAGDHSPLPAIMREVPFPLRFPASKMIFSSSRSAEIVGSKALSVTVDQRVLYWSSRDMGAREIIDNIENGDYSFGIHKELPAIYILVYRSDWPSCKLYQADVKENSVTVFELPLKIEYNDTVFFANNEFHVRIKDKWQTINAATGDMSTPTAREPEAKPNNTIWNMGRIKKIVNNGYTVLNSINYMFINADNELTLGSRHLKLNNNCLEIMPNRGLPAKVERKRRPQSATPVHLPFSNKLVKFYRFLWRDGSEAIVDSRGLLHLHSSDKTVPEITIVLIMGRNPTAAWASDGRTCGSTYFTGVNNAENADVTGFYNNYIQRFIDVLE